MPDPQKSKKGCIIAFASAALLAMVVVIGGCSWLAAQYEKRPKQPGEAELSAIHDDIMSYKGSEAFGSTSEAREIAATYARTLRLARQMLFTGGKPDGVSLSQGHFITYCSLSSNKCAFIVHVPELRRFSRDAKVSLAEMAWRMAYATVESGPPRELAVGIRGVLDYAWIYVGTTGATNAMAGIKQRHDGLKDDPLYPFFVGAPRPFGTNAPVAAASSATASDR